MPGCARLSDLLARRVACRVHAFCAALVHAQGVHVFCIQTWACKPNLMPCEWETALMMLPQTKADHENATLL